MIEKLKYYDTILMSKDLAEHVVKMLKESEISDLPNAKEACKISCKNILKDVEKKIINAIKVGGIFKIVVLQNKPPLYDSAVYSAVKEMVEKKGYKYNGCWTPGNESYNITISWGQDK